MGKDLTVVIHAIFQSQNDFELLSIGCGMAWMASEEQTK